MTNTLAAPAVRAGPHASTLVPTLLAQICFGLVMLTLCLPSMQTWGATFNVPQATVQLTFSAYVLAFGFFQLVFGPLSDQHGRRLVVLAGLMVALLGSVIGAFADSMPTLIAARFLQGAGAAAGIVAGRASIHDLFEGPTRTRVMAYVGMAMGLCPPFATVVGGQLHTRLGWQSNFVLAGALALLLIAAAWRYLPATAPKREQPPPAGPWLRTAGAAYLRLLREPGLVGYVLVMGFTGAAFYAFLSGAPLVLRSFGVGPAGVGWYIAAVPLSYIVGNFITTRLAQRLTHHQLMALGHGVTLVGIALVMVLAAWRPSPLAFALPLLLFGVGHGLSVPATLTRTVGLVPALAGAAAALGGVTQQWCGALGGYAVGWLDHDGGAMPLGWLMLVVTGLSALGPAPPLRSTPLAWTSLRCSCAGKSVATAWLG
jgi:MFS transporter, DHA1 family, multidrug resistance protein